MSKRTERAAIKRRLRANLEGESERIEITSSGTLTVFCEGFEPVVAEHWAAWFEEEEWPDVVGAE